MTAHTDIRSQAHDAAISRAKTTPQLHVPRLVRADQIHARVHGAGAVGRFNAAIAVRVTKIVGTMYCAYVFTLIALVALPAAIEQGSPTVLVNWLSSNFLQLVLLPVIIVGQNLQAKATDKRAKQTYQDAEAVLHEAIEIQKHLAAQDAVLTTLVAAAR